MIAHREGFVVRIRQVGTEAPVGVGFIVGDREIITCAHVVNAALSRDKLSAERPADTIRIQVDFPLLGDSEGAPLRNCRVAAWDPPAFDGLRGRDVAGLVLVGGDVLPPGAGASRMVDAGDLGGSQAAVFGFPGDPPRWQTGGWSTCQLRGAVGGGLLQLDAAAESSLRVQPGYSGAPVVVADKWGDAVVGMLAIASRGADAYAVAVRDIVAAWPEVLARRVIPPCPYRGLQAFTEDDAKAGLFVGREGEVSRLRSMIRTHPLVAVVGSSGVGKSSLVAAGLVPALRAEGWTVGSFRPGTAPFDSVARALLDLERPAGGHSIIDLADRADRLRSGGLWKIATQVALLTRQRVALICDQLEEVLTLTIDVEEQRRFLDHVLPGASEIPDDGNVRLVCTLRSDFLPSMLELPGIGPRLQDRQLNLSPLDAEAMTRVIVEPAAVAEVTYVPKLAGTIAREASFGRGGLPLLEFTLTELWNHQHERRLNFDDYHALGGVAGALNRHAERVYRELSEAGGLDATRIRRVLLSMVRTRDGAAAAVRGVARREDLGADWTVAEQLALPSHRLLVLGPDGPDTAEIAHEALIREWERLGRWVDEDAAFQKWLAAMEDRAADGDLLSDSRLEEAKEWLAERRADIPSAVARLIAHSQASHEQQMELEQARRRTEELLAQSQRLALELQKQSTELQRTNAELEEKAALLQEQKNNIESKNREIELARIGLEDKAQQLARASAYKSEFLAKMSHELRTPLNSLLLLARLLADNSEQNLSPKQIEFATTIHGAGSDLVEMIDDILDLAKIEAGRAEVEPSEVDYEEIGGYVEQGFSPQAAEKGLQFEVEIAPELSGQVLVTDAQRLQQILRNLVSNAVKFTDHGSVTLRIAPAPPDLDFDVPTLATARQVIAFTVADTGVGIPEDKLELVFEAFQQADGTTSRRFGGTGLGLSISRDLASLIGGTITVTSQPDRGSSFTLYVPDMLVPEAVTEQSTPRVPASRTVNGIRTTPMLRDLDRTERPASPAASQLDGATVLIIDDDVRNVFALTSALELYGMTVLYADNGTDGTQLLTEHPEVDIVLMDAMMPDQDGYETTQAIRRNHEFAELPIVFLTAKAMPGDRGSALIAGGSDYVTKPVDLDELLDLMAGWINGGRIDNGGSS